MAWREFKRGKSAKSDVQEFELRLEDNIFELHEQLAAKTYLHSSYQAFYVRDPKLRHIHKACIRDRVVHHALFRILYPIFDSEMIDDSYSCRIEKGTHRGVDRLEQFLIDLSQQINSVWAMKCDIKKFFDSIDHEILLRLIQRKIADPNALWLVQIILLSFHASRGKISLNPTGLPLGNVTSQLFANIYLNELDQFVKEQLRIKFYLRYCDDFVIVARDLCELREWSEEVAYFLETKLNLSLHQNKTITRKYRQGIDFLGYVLLLDHRMLRTKSKKRIIRKFRNNKLSENSRQAYFGVLKHCNSYGLKQKLVEVANLKIRT